MAQDQTYDLGLLERSQEKWRHSSGLRLVYRELYGEIQKRLVRGDTLELGAGIGNGREFIPDLVTSDIVKTRFVDQAASCYSVGEGGERWDNLIAVDVLHHLQQPLRFFESAAAALRPGGRIVLAEPAATRFGIRFYRRFHHEPIEPDLIEAPFDFLANGRDGRYAIPGSAKHTLDDAPERMDEFANMGMAIGLFERNRDFMVSFIGRHGLALHAIHYFGLLAYPLSGGYSQPQLLPTPLLVLILKGERVLPQFLMRRLALRVLIVLHKPGPDYTWLG